MRNTLPCIATIAWLAACDTPGGPAPVPATPPTTIAAVPSGFPNPTVLPPSIPASAWQREQEVAVDLAVHQFQFADTRLPWPPLFFVGRSGPDQQLPWTDPSRDLLLRFAGHEPPVKPASQCRVDPLGPIGVADRQTGERGVAFLLGPRAWVSETEVLVTGGYYSNGISADWNVYRVQYDGRRWAVVHVQREWIS